MNGDKTDAYPSKPIALALRKIGIDTYPENVAFLHRECPQYRSEGFQALSKVEISVGRDSRPPVVAVLNVVDDESIVGTGQLGLGENLFERLDLTEGEAAFLSHAEPPASLDAVHRKIQGERLTLVDMQLICQDIVDTRYSKIELAAFVVASDQAGLDREEVLHLTQAMLETGERLDWGEPLVADKHSIGGIPGNRTSLLVVPIVAAHGMLIPKTSSRAITSPAGTADTMEALARVDLSPEQLREIAGRVRGCLAWGGTARLAPADDIIITVERPLRIDSRGQMVASILAKKLAAGVTHLLVDIPVGPTAKVRSMSEALQLRKLFEFVADRSGLHLEAVLTDGSQPIGRGIGPLLEVRDVLQVLKNDPDAPKDLREKALRLAGRVLEFDPDLRGGQGYEVARDIVDSGRAFSKLEQIIDAQGSVPQQTIGALTFDVPSPRTGCVVAIDNHRLARVARLAGAPLDEGAGVDLLKQVGDPVEQGETLYRVYSAFEADFRFARDFIGEGNAVTIGTAGEGPSPRLTRDSDSSP